MDNFTHLLMGTLACFPLLGKISPVAIIFLWVMSVFPDLDVFLEPLQKIRKMYFLSHKAGSHSYFVGLLLTGLISLIISLIVPVAFFEIWVTGFIGYSIHITLDFFAASKVPIFYPFSKKEFRILADRAINPILGLFSGINLIILLLSYYINPSYSFLINLASFYLYIYLILFGFRIFLRTLVQIKLPKSSQYIPGFIPVFYLLLEKKVSNNYLTFQLFKRSIFSKKKKELLSKQISKDSNEMFFFEKAIDVSKDYRFFHKWTAIFPFFKENEKLINVILILAESYSRMSSHFLSVGFNKQTKQVVSKKNGFIRFKDWNKIELLG